MILYGLFIRYKPSFTNFYFFTPDTYVHQEWIKFLDINQLFVSSVYPRGYHAIVSSFYKLFFVDTYYVLRFIGPLAGALILLSIIYAVKRLFVKNQFICFMSILLYIFIADIPTMAWRQIAALPQEYAALFLLPAIVFYINFMHTKKFKYLILSSEAILITLLIHPYVTVPLGITFIVIAIFNIKTFFSKPVFKNNILMFSTAITLGVLPQIIGMIVAPDKRGTFNFVTQSIKAPTISPDTFSLDSLSPLLETAPYLRFFIILIFVYLLINILLKHIWLKKDNIIEKQQLNKANILIISSLILYYLYRAPFYGLPVIMELLRIGMFFSLLAVIAFSVSLLQINIIFKKKILVIPISIILCVALVYTAYNDKKIKTDEFKELNMEYNDSVEAYLKIKKEFKPKEWNIVSPVEHYPLIIGYGWHYEIWEFADALDRNDNEKLTIEIPDLFIFVEKKIFPDETPVSKELAVLTFITDRELLSDYYKGKTRKIIQSKVYYWAEEFLQRNDEMTVYYESDVLKVYHIHNKDSKKPVSLLNN
jgi:hypothetical protein